MRILITGGCGFLGATLSHAALERGEELFLVDNFFRKESRHNLEWLRSLGSFAFYEVDVRQAEAVKKIVRDVVPDAVFHLAGQVAMTTSISNPQIDFDINVIGGMNVLESVRQYAPNASLFYSSTNKVYGDLHGISFREETTRYVPEKYPLGFDESLPLNFQSPYGCSKGAVDQYMLDYHRIYGLRTTVFRHSSIFGPRQFATFDQGWIGWFIQQALSTKRGTSGGPFTIAGNGKQVRDVLFSDDLVRCYFSALDKYENVAGQVFNIGGGILNSLSILELLQFLESYLHIKLSFVSNAPRVSDQKFFVSDCHKAKMVFGWEPALRYEENLGRMLAWQQEIEGVVQKC